MTKIIVTVIIILKFLIKVIRKLIKIIRKSWQLSGKEKTMKEAEGLGDVNGIIDVAGERISFLLEAAMEHLMEEKEGCADKAFVGLSMLEEELGRYMEAVSELRARTFRLAGERLPLSSRN